MTELYYYTTLDYDTNYESYQPLIFIDYDHAATTYTSRDLSWGVLFPIIQPERLHCDKPAWIQIAGRGAEWVTVHWDGSQGVGYRVTLKGPNDTVVTETTDTVMTFDNLAPNSLYWVEVRRLCHHTCNMHDTVFASDQSLRLGIRTSASGIAEATDAPQATVAPNPTHGRVTVDCAAGLEAVEVYDMIGHRLTTLPASGTTADIHLTHLPQGCYILQIHSPAGTIRKPLTIQ